MALVSTGYGLSVVLVDSGDNKAVLRYVLNSADAVTAATDAASIMTALNAITGAVISKYTLHHLYEENSFSWPAGGVNVEERATVTARLGTSPSKSHTLHIPAPVDALFVATSGPDRNRVDVTETTLQDYIDLFGSGAEAEISDGEYINTALANHGILEGKRTHRRSSRG